MTWSWDEYERTPVYVRQFCWDFMMRQRRIQNDRAARSQPSGDQPGTIRVRR